jgi:prevent-host-death family protein
VYTASDGKEGANLLQVNVKDLRNRLRLLIERVEAGEEIVVTRRGKEVARLVPPSRQAKQFPDLTEFRSSIALEGEPLSHTVMRERREARY